MNTLAIVLLALLALGLGTAGFAAEEAEADAPSADLSSLAKSNNAFALDLYHHLRDARGNLFFSPSSLSTALAMTSAGARGETVGQMARVLHVELPTDRLHRAFRTLLATLDDQGGRRPYQLNVAGALWGQAGQGFRPEFLGTVRTHYGAGLNEVDFATDADGARRTINAWVARQTHDKIRDLVPSGLLGAQTRLVLTNAIYFKGSWDAPFRPQATRPAPFHLTTRQSADVPMMNQTGDYGYHDGGTFQALQMPYRGGELAMVLLLPGEVDGLADLERAMTPGALEGWIAQLRVDEVVVSLPKFTMTSEFRLDRALADLGMPLAFSGQADFSGMDGRRDLSLQAALHKAHVDVNEEGTEAAAATGLAAGFARAARPKPVFRADHPFLFLIRDTRTGVILFLGRVTDPRGR